MTPEPLPHAAMLGLAAVLERWLADQGCDGSEDRTAVTMADADALLRRLAADGFVIEEREVEDRRRAAARQSNTRREP